MRRMLWVSGVFDQTGPSSSAAMDALVQKLGPTQFDTIFLNFLHVQHDGTVVYNNTPLSKLSPHVGVALGKLKSGFQVKKKIVISLGGWGSQNDWDNLNAGHIPGFVQQVSSWAKSAGVDGIDFDYEGPLYASPYDRVISQAANGYAKAAPGSIVTLTPYVEADFWTNVLIQTATATGNNVSWINLMLYMGVYNTDPGDWPGDLAPWLSAVTAPGTNISTAQAPAFVPTGCFANGTNGSGPGGAFTYTDLSAAVANIYAQYPTMGGAFIWSFGQTGNDTAAWASAIAPSQSVKSGAAKRIKR